MVRREHKDLNGLDTAIKGILWSPILISISTIVVLTENWLLFCEYEAKERGINVVTKIKLKKS